MVVCRNKAKMVASPSSSSIASLLFIWHPLVHCPKYLHLIRHVLLPCPAALRPPCLPNTSQAHLPPMLLLSLTASLFPLSSGHCQHPHQQIGWQKEAETERYADLPPTSKQQLDKKEIVVVEGKWPNSVCFCASLQLPAQLVFVPPPPPGILRFITVLNRT